MTFSFSAPGLDLEKIAASGQCFRWTPAPLGGFLVPAAGRCAAILRVGENLHVVDYTVSGYNTQTDAAGNRFWCDYLNENAATAEYWRELDLWTKREPDSYLTRAIQAGRGMRILHQDPFETLVSYIISQNNNIPRIKRTIEALCRKLGAHHYIPTARGNFPGAEWWDFPAPEALADERALQEFGLGYRDAYVANAARAVASGRLDLAALSLCRHEEARARLKALPGVGDKVTDCVCLYGLRHEGAFPIDVHIRRVLEREFPGGFPFERFPNYAGLVQQLIFYYERESTT